MHSSWYICIQLKARTLSAGNKRSKHMLHNPEFCWHVQTAVCASSAKITDSCIASFSDSFCTGGVGLGTKVVEGGVDDEFVPIAVIFTG